MSAKDPELTVGSAGIGAFDGQPASTHSVEVMKEESIDLGGHRSRMLTPDMVSEATHIFGMTRSHRDAVQSFYPTAAEKTFVLREFLVDMDTTFDLDVPDPIGMDREAYARTRNLIKEAMPSIYDFIKGISTETPLT